MLDAAKGGVADNTLGHASEAQHYALVAGPLVDQPLEQGAYTPHNILETAVSAGGQEGRSFHGQNSRAVACGGENWYPCSASFRSTSALTCKGTGDPQTLLVDPSAARGKQSE